MGLADTRVLTLISPHSSAVRPFPAKAYVELVDAFRKTVSSIVAAIAASRSLREALQSMVEHQEDVEMYLSMFSYISDKFIEASFKATRALKLASDFLQRYV